jgi:hypothetical protein
MEDGFLGNILQALRHNPMQKKKRPFTKDIFEQVLKTVTRPIPQPQQPESGSATQKTSDRKSHGGSNGKRKR